MAKAKPHKKPGFRAQVDAAKKPRVASDPEDFYRRTPAWRLAQVQLAHPWGWHDLTGQQLLEIRAKLVNFESMTWAEILDKSGKQHHLVSVDGLCAEAKRRLEELQILTDEVLSLRLSGKERVVGLLVNGIVDILWWDPDHQVCPTTLRNT